MRSLKTSLVALLALGLVFAGQTMAAEKENDDTATYVVVIKSVSVEKTKKDGSSWDINNGAPDLSVIVRNASETDSKKFETKEKEDTFSAEYNTPTTVKVRADQTLEIHVVDNDVASDDTIGKTEVKVTSEILKDGKVELKDFGQVIRLELEMKSLK